MGDKSAIEWTDASWNPVTGCTKVSPGCTHCYAERFAERWRGTPGHPYTQGFDLRLWPERLTLPARWTRPRTIFVNSMSDLFHEKVPDSFIQQVFAAMQAAPQHRYQILTKRSARLAALAPQLDWPAYVWMGVSVESQRWLDRCAVLRQIPAAVKFVSCEPLLGPLELDLTGLDWVIVGGESGPGARAMDPEWARQLRDQCVHQQVPFFFKQWGEWDAQGQRVGKRSAGRHLDDQLWSEMPATP